MASSDYGCTTNRRIHATDDNVPRAAHGKDAPQGLWLLRLQGAEAGKGACREHGSLNFQVLPDQSSMANEGSLGVAFELSAEVWNLNGGGA